MAFAAYVLENAILLFSPRVAFARFFKAPPWVFVWTAQPQGGGKDFSSFTKEKWQMPDRWAGDGHAWNWLSHYHLSLRPWGIITPGEGYHLSLPRGLLGLFRIITPMCREKSWKVTCSPYLDYFISHPFSSQTFWSSSLLLAKELWVASIKSQVESGCYSLFSDWLLRQPYRTSATPASRNAAVVCTI